MPSASADNDTLLDSEAPSGSSSHQQLPAKTRSSPPRYPWSSRESSRLQEARVAPIHVRVQLTSLWPPRPSAWGHLHVVRAPVWETSSKATMVCGERQRRRQQRQGFSLQCPSSANLSMLRVGGILRESSRARSRWRRLQPDLPAPQPCSGPSTLSASSFPASLVPTLWPESSPLAAREDSAPSAQR